ncbi:MAG: hypothetical protein U0575_05390 [Phycisphaerales bacterium]
MRIVLALLCMLAGGGASLVMLVLLMASGANSSPERLREIWILFWSVIAVGLLGLVGALWALAKARHGVAAIAGLVPAAYCMALVVWMVVTEW